MYTPFELDKVRNLRYGMKAIHLIEKKLRTNIAKLDLDNLTMEEVATIIWAGLVHEDTALTPDSIMDLIDEHSSIPEAIEVLGQSFAEAFGANDGKNAQRATASQ
jgi:hypothetical protein